MAIGREARRLGQLPRIRAEFPNHGDAIVQIIDLFELAWHDTFGDIEAPEAVMDDIFVLAAGDLVGFVGAARLAVQDWRDLRVAADRLRLMD